MHAFIPLVLLLADPLIAPRPCCPPAARNPHAPAILASAAEQAAKRAERLAANPKGPKGAGAPRKRKKVRAMWGSLCGHNIRLRSMPVAGPLACLPRPCTPPRVRSLYLGTCAGSLTVARPHGLGVVPALQVGDEETDEEEEWEALFGPAATTGGRRSRQRSRKQFGECGELRARDGTCTGRQTAGASTAASSAVRVQRVGQFCSAVVAQVSTSDAKPCCCPPCLPLRRRFCERPGRGVGGGGTQRRRRSAKLWWAAGSPGSTA